MLKQLLENNEEEKMGELCRKLSKKAAYIEVFNEKDKLLEELKEHLNKEGNAILNNFLSCLISEGAISDEFYYKSGFMDGIKLMKSIEKV